MEQLRRHLAADLDALAAANDGLVPQRVVDGFRGALAHRVERGERRLVASVKRRETEVLRRIAALRGALYPHGAPQERRLSFIPFLVRYGQELVEEMLAQATIHARGIVGAQAALGTARAAPVSART